MNNAIIGTRINASLARKNGMKQKELAHLIGVTDNTISYFCSGARKPNLEQLVEIAKVLEVTTDYLLGLDDNYSIDVDMQIASKTTGLSNQSIEALRSFPEWDGAINRQQMDALDDLLQSNAFWDMLASIGLLKYRISIGANKKNYHFIQECKLSYLDVVESVPRIMDEKYNYHNVINKAWDEITVQQQQYAEILKKQILMEGSDDGKH